MNESGTYTRDLAQFAESFRRRQRKQVWRDDSLATAEKMLFVGFYFVRKLIECKKVRDDCARMSFPIGKGPIKRKHKVSDFYRTDMILDVDELEWNDVRVNVGQIADSIIHAWWIMPIRAELRGLHGYTFTTDRKRNSEVFLLPITTIVDVFDAFSKGQVMSIHTVHDKKTGELKYVERN